jgi:hypothetical protein
MTSLGAVLEQYPNEVIVYVSDPRTGVQRGCEWPPSIANVVKACEQRVLEIQLNQKFETWGQRNLAGPEPSPRYRSAPVAGPGDLASVFVPTNHVRYEKLVAWAREADKRLYRYGESSDGRPGIWVAYNIWDERQAVARRALAEATEQSFALSAAALKVMRDVDQGRSWGDGEASDGAHR